MAAEAKAKARWLEKLRDRRRNRAERRSDVDPRKMRDATRGNKDNAARHGAGY